MNNPDRDPRSALKYGFIVDPNGNQIPLDENGIPINVPKVPLGERKVRITFDLTVEQAHNLAFHILWAEPNVDWRMPHISRDGEESVYLDKDEKAYDTLLNALTAALDVFTEHCTAIGAVSQTFDEAEFRSYNH